MYNENTVNHLKRIPIFIDSKEVDAIIDSGTQIALVHSSLVPKLKNKKESKIFFNSAFGKQIEAKVCCMIIYFKNYDNNLSISVNTLVAVTDQYNVPCLVTPEIHGLLTNSPHEERKVQVVHFETKEECIGENIPPKRSSAETVKGEN
ncbi:uncharacterized protein TNCV_3193631 [Trichonephila clavipes]|nr:uncharacterized protein TNCV_3193631 [Trichonephila clavipes]